MSLEGGDIRRFVGVVRDIEAAFGSARRIMHDAEIRKRDLVRRSIFAARDLVAGQALTLADLDFRRPGTGIPPGEAARIVGRSLTVAKRAGEMLRYADLAGGT